MRRESEPILEVENLEIAFPSAEGALHAVNGVSLDLRPGETLGIVGESGCGKSTIGRAILGLVPSPGKIVGGSIRFQGNDITRFSGEQLRAYRGNRVAMIFQDPMSTLNPVMTIGTQIREALSIHNVAKGAAATARATKLLDLVGIPDARSRLDAYPHQLSGGMRQRAGIAMAISCEPDVLIADEPTTALDVTVQAQVIDLLGSLRDEFGMAIVLISHDLGVVSSIADRVMVLYSGYVVESGTTGKVLGRRLHPYTEGLIGSRTEINGPRPDRLHAIPGAAPALMGPAAECPFRPRCPVAENVCTLSNPPLVAVENMHEAACHVRAPQPVQPVEIRKRRGAQ
jgi:oligopeptide/dipeptide ABC transporter, ATP-binding protein, C-terminal domain